MLSLLTGNEDDSEENENYTEMSKHGQWIRRRLLDGSLNRVPIGFYSKGIIFEIYFTFISSYI